MSDALNLTSNNFQSEVLQSHQPVLVDFWAPWCMPCKMIAPIVDKVSATYAGKLKVAKLNTDDEPSLSAQYDVTGIPCLILFKSGEPVDRIVGYVPERHLMSMIEKNLAPVA